MGTLAKPFEVSRTLTHKELATLILEARDTFVASDTEDVVSEWLLEKFGAEVISANFVIFNQGTGADGALRWLKSFMKGFGDLANYCISHHKADYHVKPVEVTTMELVQEEPEDDFGKSKAPEAGAETV